MDPKRAFDKLRFRPGRLSTAALTAASLVFCSGADGSTPVRAKAPSATGVPQSHANDHLADLSDTARGIHQTITPADRPTPAALSPGTLEQITVTAEKIKERAIDVPVSMTTLSAASLASLNATRFLDFANTVPGLDYSTAGAGFTQISMRGVTTGYDVSSTVGVYFDDVPVGSSSVFALGNLFAFDPALFDIQNIEVLRGPQGTLYGASAMGGLIAYTSTPPDESGVHGDAQAGVSKIEGGGTSYDIASSLNLPVFGDRAALRLTGYQTHNGGFINDIALNRSEVDAGDTDGGLMDLAVQPNESLHLSLTALLQNSSRDGESTADYTASGSMPYGPYGQYRPYPGGEPFDEHFNLLIGRASYDVGALTLTSITGYQAMRESNIWDVSSEFAPLCALLESFSCTSFAAQSNLTLHKLTQEVRATSKLGHRLEWLLGVFYTRETSSQYEFFLLRGSNSQPEPNNLFTYYVPSLYEEKAAFGDLTWHVSGKLAVTGGLRYAHDDQDFSQAGAGLLAGSKPLSGSAESVRNYLGTIRYFLGRNATAYLRYATGYRPGGPNYVTLNPVTGNPNGPPSSRPDSLKNYEAGVKLETADDRLAIDAAIYKINWDDIQVAVNTGGFSSITNAPGGASVDGGEITLRSREFGSLSTGASLSYTHAYINEGTPALGAAPGERLPGSPRITASLNGL
jgi:iron complex outermembrane receptor protein